MSEAQRLATMTMREADTKRKGGKKRPKDDEVRIRMWLLSFADTLNIIGEMQGFGGFGGKKNKR